MAFSSIADKYIEANITTQNLIPAGVATAASAVEVDTRGKTTVGIQIQGTYTGVMSVQVRVTASSVWTTLSGASVVLRSTGAYSATMPSATPGVYQMECAGYSAVRVTALAAVTGTCTVSMRASVANSMTSIDNALPAGAAAIGTIGVTSVSAGTTAIGDVGIQARANATGAATIAKIQSAATTNATVIKASAGRVLGYCLTNTSAAIKVFRFYNTTTAPTVGTTVPTHNVVLPIGACVNLSPTVGIGHATGITYSITGGLADNDATAVAANDVIGTVYYA